MRPSPTLRSTPPSRANAEMKVELSRDYAFEAAHRLPKVPPDHKCYRVHGHSYRIEVTIAGEVDPTLGWLVDFADITAGGETGLQKELHHPGLNDRAGVRERATRDTAAWPWERRR